MSPSVQADSIKAGVIDRESAGVSHPRLNRPCISCGAPLPQKRLQANPLATECVPCLESAGDVPRLKRYDEATGRDNEVAQSYFTTNEEIERHIRRTNSKIASEEAFDIARGDDSHLVRDNSVPKEHAYSMDEAFERDVEERDNVIIMPVIPQAPVVQQVAVQ